MCDLIVCCAKFVYILLPCLLTSLLILFIFFSTQTDGSVPNTLVIANCEVVKPRVAAAEHISQVLLLWIIITHFSLIFSPPVPLHFFHIWLHWLCLYHCMIMVSFPCLILQFNEEARSPFVKKYKTIIHPGEVSVTFLHFCLSQICGFISSCGHLPIYHLLYSRFVTVHNCNLSKHACSLTGVVYKIILCCSAF